MVTPVGLNSRPWELLVGHNHRPVHTIRRQVHSADGEVIVAGDTGERALRVRVRIVGCPPTPWDALRKGIVGHELGESLSMGSSVCRVTVRNILGKISCESCNSKFKERGGPISGRIARRVTHRDNIIT